MKLKQLLELKKSSKLIFALMALLAVFSFLICTSASAEEEEVASSEFKVNAGLLEGITTTGENFLMTDILVKHPDGEPMFDILPSDAWYRRIQTQGIVVNQVRFNYPFGDSDTFAGAVYIDDHDSGSGVRYSPNHWGIKELDTLDFTALIVEGNKYQMNIDLVYEFLPGYGVEGHGIYRVNNDFQQVLGDIEASVWHNWERDGSLRGYASWINIGDENIFLFGLKATTK